MNLYQVLGLQHSYIQYLSHPTHLISLSTLLYIAGEQVSYPKEKSTLTSMEKEKKQKRGKQTQGRKEGYVEG